MVHSVSVELPATKDFLDRVRAATQKDRELQLLTQQVKLGWPKKINEVDEQIKCYWSFREDITVTDDILVKGHRIIVPKSMHEYMLKQVHEGHFGMDKCNMRMSNCCYWPNVNKETEEMIRNCPTCLEFTPTKPKTKKKDMLHHEIPSTPWTKLATDIFHFQGANYLVLVDYTSKFPVVKQLQKIDQRAVTTAFEEVFTERGYPDELVSDNGPCYRGKQFFEFLRRKGIKHMTSSPYYPQSNGLAETYVKVVKNMMKKAQKCKVRFNDMLYQYRTSPLAGKRESPIELLEQRKPRTNMPYLGKGEHRSLITPWALDHLMRNPPAATHAQPAYTHKYPVGKAVMFNTPKPGPFQVRYPAIIVAQLPEPRSYLIENNDGKITRRTEQHMRPYTPERPRSRREPFDPLASTDSDSSFFDPEESTLEAHKRRWRKRNLRPTPSPTARRSQNLRFTPSPTMRSAQSPDSEYKQEEVPAIEIEEQENPAAKGGMFHIAQKSQIIPSFEHEQNDTFS